LPEAVVQFQQLSRGAVKAFPSLAQRVQADLEREWGFLL
jgi:hypothetical protein